jgi:hypothetical protein
MSVHCPQVDAAAAASRAQLVHLEAAEQLKCGRHTAGFKMTQHYVMLLHCPQVNAAAAAGGAQLMHLGQQEQQQRWNSLQKDTRH